MKKFIILISIVMIASYVSAQKDNSEEDFKTGKHFKMPNITKYKNKSWSAKNSDSQLTFDLEIIKKDFKTKDVNFSVDAFQLKIKKMMYNGENIASKLKEDVLMLSTAWPTRFIGFYTDPVRNTMLKITLDYAEEKKLIFTSKAYLNTKDDLKNGTIFPSGPIILESKF